MRRCFGLARNLHRCARKGDWRLFCHEHRRQPIAWVIFLVFTVLAGAASIYSAWFSPDRSSEAVQSLRDEAARVASLTAKVTIRVTGAWSKEKPPSGSVSLLYSPDPQLIVRALIDTEGTREVSFRIVGSADLKAEGQATVISFEAEPPAGSSIFGTDLRAVSSYSWAQVALLGIEQTSTTDKFIRLESVRVQLFANGKLHLDAQETPAGEAPQPLPEKSPRITIVPRQPWKPVASVSSFEECRLTTQWS